MSMQVSPAMLAGVSRPGGTVISAEALDLITRLRDHYREVGKSSAAHNYSRHLKSFFSWAEAAGYSVKNLPPESLETFLSTLRAAGQKETTLYVMRTQLKSALKAATEVLGTDFGHLQYETGKPREVRAVQKAKEKRQRTEKRVVQTVQQLQALQAAQNTIFGTSAAPVATSYASAPAAPVISDTLTDSIDIPEDDSMSETSAPQSTGGTTTNGQQPVVVLQVPPQPQRPLATVGAGNQQRQNNAQPQRGVVLNNHTFNGPYIRVSYVADGSSVIPAGSEVALRVYPASQLAPHGDIATFLQSYVIPEMRLPPTVAQVQFVFHELNDRKQPTGRRDEMIVSVPAALGFGPAQTQQAPQPAAGFGYAPSAPPAMDSMTNYLLQKLDRDLEEAKKREERAQEEMKKATDSQTTFLLMQQFQKEQDLRRQIEEDRRRELERINRADALSAAPPMPMTPPMPFPTILPPEPPRDTGMAEFAKVVADSNSRMMELMLAALNKPVPTPTPQKDVAEWLVPLMTQMNQQAMQQQQANQQLLVGVMQSMMNREDPMMKFVMAQMQEVKAAAATPKADELESFADKLQKMKMVSDMLGGGSGNGGLLADLLANADVIGAGAAKVIQAAKTGQPLPTPAQLAAKPTVQPNSQPQLTAGGASASTPMIPAPPEEALAHLQAVVTGVEQDDDQAVINGVVEIVKTFMAAPEPYPSTGRKILAAFKNADDEGELYTLAKNLWTVLGQQYDRPAAKAVAKVLAKWYSIIHQQIFGEPRELMADGEVEEEDGEIDETDGSDDDHDEAPTLVAGG